MADNVLLCKERYGKASVDREYYTTKPHVPEQKGSADYNGLTASSLCDTSRPVVIKNRSSHARNFNQVLESIFLPQGYPDSVSKDYLAYQIWDTIQAFASSITGTLATRAVLQGYGVGDENATATAATITWILKDGTGMFGRIVFAWLKGSSLDCDAKRWRYFADMLNDFAISMDLIAPFFKNYFTAIVCFSGVCRSIVGVAGGATRAALTQHQARRNNMADVSAKDGSQETMVNLAALLCSMVLIPLVAQNQSLVWLCYVIFTALHLFANYKAVTVVVMESLNQARLKIIIEHYLTRDSYFAPVRLVNYLEPVVWGTRRIFDIQLGVSYRKLLTKSGNTWKVDRGLCLIHDSENKYILRCKNRVITIVLSSRAGKEDQLRACFQAEVLNFAQQAAKKSLCQGQVISCPHFLNLIRGLKSGDVASIEYDLQMFTVKHFMKFKPGLLNAGWTLSPMLLSADEWRADWEDDSNFPATSTTLFTDI
ncbi:RUS family member 1-like [Tubulanus polymorphus]|uniref:RUS family member 1-like n=1 Tax=Tubulanus polymorphus TaxID=672921 RepID=UPI003DA339A3